MTDILDEPEDDQDYIDDESGDSTIIDSLLDKYSKSRDELESDLEDITKLKNHLGSLFPDDINFRNKFILEEKIKSTTGFYSTILSIRQEINKTLSNEIDIRRKITSKDKDVGGIDIRKLADELELLSKKKED